MITADNITDEQIRELHTTISTFNMSDATAIHRAFHAIGTTGRRSPQWFRNRRWARERCAEILNLKGKP